MADEMKVMKILLNNCKGIANGQRRLRPQYRIL